MPVYAYTLRQEYNKGIEKIEALEADMEVFQQEIEKSSEMKRQHQYNRKFAIRKIDEIKREILAIQAKNRRLDACINLMCSYNENE